MCPSMWHSGLPFLSLCASRMTSFLLFICPSFHAGKFSRFSFFCQLQLSHREFSSFAASENFANQIALIHRTESLSAMSSSCFLRRVGSKSLSRGFLRFHDACIFSFRSIFPSHKAWLFPLLPISSLRFLWFPCTLHLLDRRSKYLSIFEHCQALVSHSPILFSFFLAFFNMPTTDILSLKLLPKRIPTRLSQITFPITVLPKGDRTDFAQEERLGLPYWTRAISVVEDESKSLDIPMRYFL